jgi:hypothetical protein
MKYKAGGYYKNIAINFHFGKNKTVMDTLHEDQNVETKHSWLCEISSSFLWGHPP